MSLYKFVTVKTEYGPVKGAQTSTAFGRDIFKFETVPYMKAPVGKLRFRDAQSPDKWTEPFDSTVERPFYVTWNMFTLDVHGNEDAGVLSITTPYLDRKLPVAVYIHGGGFQFAHGPSEMFGCDYILQKDVVFVTINYRVGPIGFLSLNDPKLGIPGNAGLKDQVFALKWIKKNIANFGGDPNNITVFGTSAGGSSVHFLMMSEQAKGLFQRAIPMSGTSFIKGWASAPKKDLTERLAKSLGWNGEGGESKMLEVLENADARELVDKEANLLTEEEKFGEHIAFPFTPVVEPYVTKTTFLPKDPVLLGRNAWGNDIDCMLGGTSAEGGFMAIFKGNYLDYFQTPENFVLARELKLDLTKASDKQKANEIGGKLQKLYFGDDKYPDLDYHKYLQFAGDLHFWHGIYRATKSRVAAKGKGKTFLYRFDLQTKLGFFKMFSTFELGGASHGEDIGYLFLSKGPLAMTPPAIDSIEFELIKKTVAIVTSFIISGNPNESSWEPLTSESPLKCLNMTNDAFEIIELPEEKRLKVVDELFAKEGVALY